MKKAKIEEASTPCFGKAKEFFIFWFNTETGEVAFTQEQSDFIEEHYLSHPDRAFLFVWLYDLAEFLETSRRNLEWQAFKPIAPAEPR